MAKRSDFLHIILFLTTVSLVCLVMFYDLFSTGFHLMDDYNFILINKRLEANLSILDITIDYIKSDLRYQRFRPLYQLMWVLEVKLFGINYNSHLILHIFYLIISALFFYLFVRSKILNYDFLLALSFVMIIFFGEQLAIYYMFGSGEARSLLFIVISFYLLNFLHNPLTQTNRFFYRFLIYFFAFLASLCKESFITFIPTLVFFDLFLEKKIFKLTLYDVLKNNIQFIILISSFVLCYVFFVLMYVGTGYGPQDYKKENPLVLIFSRFTEILTIYHYGFTILLVLTLIFVGIFTILPRKDIKNLFLNELLYVLLILITTLIAQIFVYRGYGFIGDKRYLIPLTIVISFFITYLINVYRIQIKDKIKQNIQNLSYILVFSPILIIPYNNILHIKEHIKNFASVGIDTSKLFNVLTTHTKPKGTILLVMDLSYMPCPEDYGAIKIYLRDFYHIENKVVYQGLMNDSLVYKNLDSDYQSYLLSAFQTIQEAKEDFKIITANEIKNILLYDHTLLNFIKQNTWFKKEDFIAYKAKSMIYFRRK